MNAEQFDKLLTALNACEEAKEWANGKSLDEVWRTCERGDWMLWLFHRMQDKDGWGDLRNKTAAKVKCARLVEHLMTDERSKKALEVAQRYADGLATDKELSSAASAAYAAASAASAAYAAAYAASAADAADAAASAASAAYAAAYAASAAYAAAYAASAASAAAKNDILKKCADICRDILITPVNIHKSTQNHGNSEN